jgi:hypothetical protein
MNIDRGKCRPGCSRLNAVQPRLARGSLRRAPAAQGVCGLLAAAVVLAVSFSTGCSRTFYRRQADIDAYSLVREKAIHPHWRLPDYTISVDPRSRMYDPYAIDCPPIPPDDPTAHQLMHCVDGKRGWPFWHDNGDRPYVENPAWPEYIQVDERGVLRLNRDDAVRLALLHSREYQQQLETLYLAALDVSFERFAFDSQFFAGYSLFGTWDGRARSGLAKLTGVDGNSSSELRASTFTTNNPIGIQVRKSLTTGGTMLADFANALVWQFSGPDNFTPNTIVDFTLVQPLLRNGGRDRVMETLTRSERNLLYNVRIMEQYRQAFYVDTLTGGGTQGSTTTRAGGVQGQGLTGFQGVGGAGFGNVQTVGGAAGTQAGAAGANNFIGLLQQQRLIRNQEDTIRRLRRNLTRMTTLLVEQPSEQTGAYLSQALQVAQSRQALLTQESSLVTARNNYQVDLDTFKVNELALPPQICIEPADNLLDRFELIQQDVIRLPEDWEAVLGNHMEVRRDIPQRIQSNVESVARPAMDPLCRLRRYDGLDEDLTRLRPALAEMRQFADQIITLHLSTIQQDIEKLRQAVPRRKAWLEKLSQRIEELRQTPCELLPLGVNPFEAAGGQFARDRLARLDKSLADAQRSYQNLSQNFQGYAQTLADRSRLVDELLQNKEQTPEELFEKLVRGVFNSQYECGKTRVLTMDVVEDINRELIELQLLQAIARTETVELQEVDLRFDQALDVARRYRRDWMNARGALVDQWRLLQFNADRLQATLDIFFSGDISNIGDNPFRLRANTGRLRAGVQFDAPITRLSERNAYRQSLIEYQQARRNFYRFEDQVAQALRGRLRSLTSFEINFELNRLAVLEAARQVMLNTFIDQDAQRTATTRVTAARDAVQALTDLLNAQNQFMLVFISYEVQRLALDFNLGTMQLDSEGLWIDPGRIGTDYGQFDPWLWRSHPSAGGTTAGDGSSETLPPAKRSDPLEQLPPDFMLPPAQGETLPKPGFDSLPLVPPARER